MGEVMSIFNFNVEELMSFFAVLVRYSVLIGVLPFVGDKFIPGPAKVLLALAISIALFPALVNSGQVRTGDALVWGATPAGIVGTITMEILFALVLGFTARLVFDAIHFGSNLVGNFMGFAIASAYDPHMESQSQVVAEIQIALAMLIFLAIDGHHLMLRASLDSYRLVGVGRASLMDPLFHQRLIEMTGQVVKLGIQLAAPIAVSLFAVNVGFGVMAKAMPQLNILVLSFAVTALIGLLAMWIGLPEFQLASGNILGRIGEWMDGMVSAMRGTGG